jgi:7,8-dihydropterin-6-yl-methyl-4-(beta-D-ribofuranosyl)aminobenzene 5'-phosphate synthase
MTAADTLTTVDSVEVCVVVDNVLDILSTVPDCVTPEVPNLLRAGATELSGSCLCCAAWGLSLLITTRVGDTRRTMLFDAGPEAYALARNATRLGVDFGSIECVALSHGHFDHAAGLPKALELITAANGGVAVPMHVNPGMFCDRALKLPTGKILPLGAVPSADELTTAGGDVHNSGESRTVLGDTVFISGEIPRVTDYERGFPPHLRRDGDDWVPDPLIVDERFLAINVKDHGILVFSSCSHAGVVNVMRNARDLFHSAPLFAVFGGLHLSGAANEQWIAPTVQDLASFGLKRVIPGHCTGWRAVQALVSKLGDVVIPSAVGQVHRFGADAPS